MKLIKPRIFNFLIKIIFIIKYLDSILKVKKEPVQHGEASMGRITQACRLLETAMMLFFYFFAWPHTVDLSFDEFYLCY